MGDQNKSGRGKEQHVTYNPLLKPGPKRGVPRGVPEASAQTSTPAAKPQWFDWNGKQAMLIAGKAVAPRDGAKFQNPTPPGLKIAAKPQPFRIKASKPKRI